MALPFFYANDLNDQVMQLNEDNSKYIVNVLRMQKGESLLLTDGLGKKAEAVITDDNRKRCVVHINKLSTQAKDTPIIYIGISLIKNTSRFEWFLEKATEIGVSGIIPLLCERTEKEKFRQDRMENILVSAMLQSQQCWKPELYSPIEIKQLTSNNDYNIKLIAHCMENEKRELTSILPQLFEQHQSSCLILIGPEGDFTESEINYSIASGFKPVSLGKTRLRTETAGMVAAALLCSVRR